MTRVMQIPVRRRQNNWRNKVKVKSTVNSRKEIYTVESSKESKLPGGNLRYRKED